MAQQVPQANDRKRVKVYELRENDWYDRGTGFCTGQVINDEPKILVESEDQPDRMLLETRIVKDDSYQKQQDTLIVWTEPNGTDMALSFQEAEGCAAIWGFLSEVQQHLNALAGPDDYPSDDAMEFGHAIGLPPPELGNLPDIEKLMRAASTNPNGRDHLSKFIIRDDYIKKLIPLVEMAEDLESLIDLHRLCNIMKSLILLNDNAIIEHAVADDIILGVVGALEYDPDFPTHKANHRQYLSDVNRFREVVPIKDPLIRQKIRQTWRLQYLKDVVLARILDDPTFSVLNSLIFFNQVDIVTHLQSNQAFLKELFAVFDIKNTDIKRKEDAVQFLHQCAAIAKNLQAPARAQLFANFINHGLFLVIAFAIKHPNPSMRTTGIDILVALLDHDPVIMRGYMLKAIRDKRTPLTDTLIELLHAETDLGVKNQLADAIKILLDPQAPVGDHLGRSGSEGFLSKLNRPSVDPNQQASEQFAQDHFDRSCRKLFNPLRALESRLSMTNFTYQEVSLHSHLLEILTYFVRQHSMRSRHFVLSENLAPRAAQLLCVPQKPLKLVALKFFRTCISLQDQFYASQITQNNTFELILGIVIETMPRDNLLNSACLELFEFIKRENIKPIITHVVERYREKLESITYVDTFQNLIIRYEQMIAYNPETDTSLFSQEEETSPQTNANGHRWQGLKEMDADQEEYFNTSDDEDDERPQQLVEFNAARTPEGGLFEKQPDLNGATSPLVKPLVDYPDDDEEDITEMRAAPPMIENQSDAAALTEEPPAQRKLQPSSEVSSVTPPERLSEKRRREEDEDEDELGKLSTGIKRRSSNASNSSTSSLRRKTGMMGMTKKENKSQSPDDNGRKKISVHLQSSKGENAASDGGQDDSGTGA
ncbi:hypothetical protein UCRPC4_g01694 [Phaeomoniella chlamydospora]|uniref:Uncharacterized protein n=1 Tax=Phaeomoniella chlamydospora TaxID=158046 RepID=A0A0G2GQI0_PHACM|nr:hypothetical protein UCRPC4_g01694 [Phaeomoniella chlamydospora]